MNRYNISWIAQGNGTSGSEIVDTKSSGPNNAAEYVLKFNTSVADEYTVTVFGYNKRGSESGHFKVFIYSWKVFIYMAFSSTYL